MKRVGIIALTIGLFLETLTVAPRQAWGQLAVFDASAVFQLAASVRQQIELVAQGTRDLAPWIEGSQVSQDIEKLVRLGTKLAGIGVTLSARRSGWLDMTSTAQIPTTLEALDTWTFQARKWAIDGAREASSAMDLLTDAVELVNTALSLLSRIPGISGSVGGLQTVSSALSSLSGLFAGMQGLIAPYQQALLGQQMIKDVAAQVWRESISVQHLSDWGVME